jgi:TolB-like protein
MSQREDDAPTPTPTTRLGLWRRLIGALGSGDASPPRGADPSRIGRYRVVGRLGQGGMGVVYEALDESLGRRLAVKTIREPDEAARQRFRREARAAARVSHPNVCQLFEIGEDEDGRLFLAMELLAGRTLAERLREGPLPVGEVVSLGREMLSALAALHEAGIVHRDLKPSNVFLTPHGVKLLDFGLARPVPTELTQTIETGAELTRPGVVLGTPRYMAPEQVTGHEVDARTDLFAVGAVLYEALAGRPPFAGVTMVEVLSATLHESPPALTGSAAIVAVDRVVRRALAKSPGERFATAAGMARELAAVSLDESREQPAAAHALRRLIVLPFRLLREDPEIDFLAFALADAVTGSLAGLPSLVVRSTAAGARFAGETPDVREIAAGAEVDLVVTGTLLRAGGQLRLTSQLVEAPSGTLVSSFTTQSPVGDPFRLQDELAGRLVASFSKSLAAGEPVPRRDVPRTARAYELFLRGNDIARDWSQVRLAREMYEGCLAEDPEYAPAWARLARCRRLLGKYHLEDTAANVKGAEDALRRALSLDPDLPIAHKIYAHLEAEGGRAREAMARLIALGRRRRNDPEVFAGLVHSCRYAGLLEASLAAHREARRLDPHGSTSVSYTHWMRGDLEAVVAEPADPDDYELSVFALIALGRHDEARERIANLPPDGGIPVARLVFDAIRAMESPDEALSAERLRACVRVHTDPEALFVYGSALARRSDEEAVGWIARAVEGGFCAVEAFSHPWLAGVRDRPEVLVLRERATAARTEAVRVFRESGGPELLGASAAAQ